MEDALRRALRDVCDVQTLVASCIPPPAPPLEEVLEASPGLPNEPAPTLTGLDKILAQARTAYVADDRPISPGPSADSAQAAFMTALETLPCDGNPDSLVLDMGEWQGWEDTVDFAKSELQQVLRNMPTGNEFASTAAQWFTTKEAVRICKLMQRIGQQVAIARAVNTRFSECTGALMNSMTIDEEITQLHIRLHQQLRPVLLQQLAHAACERRLKEFWEIWRFGRWVLGPRKHAASPPCAIAVLPRLD